VEHRPHGRRQLLAHPIADAHRERRLHLAWTV
jgi:hypothetical protein